MPSRFDRSLDRQLAVCLGDQGAHGIVEGGLIERADLDMEIDAFFVVGDLIMDTPALTTDGMLAKIRFVKTSYLVSAKS